MATVAVVLNTTKRLSNNEFSVSLRITHQRDRKYYSFSTLIVDQSLKFRCGTTDWLPPEAEDNGFGKFRKTYPEYKRCNEILKSKLDEALAILKMYDSNGTLFSFSQFELDLKGVTNSRSMEVPQKGAKSIPTITLESYYEQQIKLLEEQGRQGMSGLFLEVKRILKIFKPQALLTDVTFRFLESFEYWMRNIRGNKDTTISVKMRNLQRVINLAIEDKLFDKDEYPFGEKKYSINKRLDNKTKKIAITTDRIAKLKALVIEPGTWLYISQQLFLFSYYSRGMNFVDMAYLTWDRVTENQIHYVRLKTRGQFDIPINEYNGAILHYFKTHYCVPGNFVFPILDITVHKTLKQQYTRKKTALKAVNDNLKKLAEMIGEPNLKLTTNVGRHTYATGLKRAGANTAYITEALGHATQEQTQTYLAEFEKGEIESWENQMFQQ